MLYFPLSLWRYFNTFAVLFCCAASPNLNYLSKMQLCFGNRILCSNSCFSINVYILLFLMCETCCGFWFLGDFVCSAVCPWKSCCLRSTLIYWTFFVFVYLSIFMILIQMWFLTLYLYFLVGYDLNENVFVFLSIFMVLMYVFEFLSLLPYWHKFIFILNHIIIIIIIINVRRS